MNTSSAEFFEAKYRAAADPWDFAGSAYEQGRYAATLAALQGQRFRHGLEPGCSVGVLTERLAELCDRLEAFDFSPTAVRAARQRCASLPSVSIRCDSLTPSTFFAGRDLLVLSEIGYYFTGAEWSELVDTMLGELPSGATVLATHWLGHSSDHRISGDEVHRILKVRPGLERRRTERHAEFRLDCWSVR